MAHKCNMRQLFAIPASYENNIALVKMEGCDVHARPLPLFLAAVFSLALYHKNAQILWLGQELNPGPPKQTMTLPLDYQAGLKTITCFVDPNYLQDLYRQGRETDMKSNTSLKLKPERKQEEQLLK